MSDGSCSRRQFLSRGLSAGVLAAACSSSLHGESSHSNATDSSAVPSVLVDLTRCTGCRACVRACTLSNDLPETNDSQEIRLERDQTLSHQLWTAVNLQTAEMPDGNSVSRPVKKQCMHCLEPACASACPVAALYRHKDGPVLYRAERCIGCRYCMVACPFEVPKFQWDSGLSPVIGKCQFCFGQRLAEGRLPGCVSACPTGALKFGTREQTLFEARARIHARPERYVDHVYGEHEAGGTSWLYLSDVPFDQLNFVKDLPDSPLPSLPRFVLSKLPSVALILAGLLGGLSYVLRRAEKEA